MKRLAIVHWSHRSSATMTAFYEPTGVYIAWPTTGAMTHRATGERVVPGRGFRFEPGEYFELDFEERTEWQCVEFAPEDAEPARIGADTAPTRQDGTVTENEDADDGRAPICPYCGVTALPAEGRDSFVCENPDCDAFGDSVAT